VLGRCRRVLEHTGSIISGILSPDGMLVASASYDSPVRIYDAKTGQCRQILEGHIQSVTSVAFSHDGVLVASASSDKTIRICDVATGRCCRMLEGYSGSVTSVSFSSDSMLMASASGDKTVRIWDTPTGQCRQTIPIGATSKHLSFEINGSYLYIVAIDLNEIGPARFATSKTLLSASAKISDFGISEDRRWIASYGKNLLWLPVEFRPTKLTLSGTPVAISGTTVAIGCALARCLIIQFSKHPTKLA
jgi:WD40 repeat protein